MRFLYKALMGSWDLQCNANSESVQAPKVYMNTVRNVYIANDYPNSSCLVRHDYTDVHAHAHKTHPVKDLHNSAVQDIHCLD